MSDPPIIPTTGPADKKAGKMIYTSEYILTSNPELYPHLDHLDNIYGLQWGSWYSW